MSLIFLFLFSFLASFKTSAQNPNLVRIVCPNTTTYSRNSTYFTNLKVLLSSLSSRNASYATGFQNATSGQEPDRVTGLFLCRGDVSPEVCRNCVATTVNQSLVQCPKESEASLFYDECLLRYSHRNILSTLTMDGGTTRTNQNSISSKQVDKFTDLVSSTMHQAAFEAARSSRKFYAYRTNWTAFQNLSGLVQCTPDLTEQDCLICLQRSISVTPLHRIGATRFRPSCTMRYELYAFYDETAIRLPPPLPQASTPPEQSPPPSVKGGNLNVLVPAIVVPVTVAFIVLISGYCFFAKRAKRIDGAEIAFDGDDVTTIESLQLDYRIIQAATNDYSENNRIGGGGFGEVYKGMLPNGTEVAVKKLSKSSRQGDKEFKNEVVVVAKLQHKNLVRLLGFSHEREERILVYEYVPNKSLDYFLFDHAMQGQLDWTRRYTIIGGVARGMLYLHQDSRLTVIHRDLKASNILLDADMNPKIADFGLAKIVGMDQSHASTSRIVGTYGYMSPEYVMRGQFSMKSDVYSFGVLVLEIISGRKNNNFYETEDAYDLVTYAWRLWRNGAALDFVDSVIADRCLKSEVVRCIHISLLCVQEDPADRPTFSTISVMLTSNSITLPVPKQPGFFVRNRPEKDPLDSNQSKTSKPISGDIDDASITDLYPR